MATWGNQVKEEEPIRFTSAATYLPSQNPALPSSSSEQDSNNTAEDGRRVYIGNLDQRVTEFHLLKIVQPFGSLKAFKFHHKRFGDATDSRKKFAFVTYTTTEAAQKCMRSLNGKRVCGRTLRLSLAQETFWIRSEKEEKVKALLPVLGMKGRQNLNKEITDEDQEELKQQRAKLIEAIEMKLRAIEREKANC